MDSSIKNSEDNSFRLLIKPYVKKLLLVFFGVIVLNLIVEMFFEVSDKLQVLNKLSLTIAIILTVVVLFAYACVSLRENLGRSIREDVMVLPLRFVTFIVLFITLSKIGYDTVLLKEEKNKLLNVGLSEYTQTVIVDGWEKDAFNNSELDAMYTEIFSKPGGNKTGFLTQQEWEAKNIPFPYVPFVGHEKQWHYAAKFTQQMVNVVRMFDLQKRFKINDSAALAKSFTGPFAGWFTCFRKFMSVAIVRNLWEQQKYSHVNPKFTAWVQYYVTDVVDKDPDFWQHNRERWDKSVAEFLK